MIRAILVCTALAGASAMAATPMTLSLDAQGDPIVRYRFEPGQTRIVFTDPDERLFAEVRKPSWKFDTACFSLTERAIERQKAECGDLVVKLTWGEEVRDRLYPPLVKFRNGGLLVFAGYIEAVTADASRVQEIRVAAPAGSVVAFRDTKVTDSLVLPSATFATSGDGWIYLGPDRFVDDPAGLLMIDEGVPDAIRAQISDTLAKVMKVYKDRMGPLAEGRPSIYVTWAQRDKNTRSWQADVVPGNVMRFGLAGSQWATLDETRLRAFIDTIAHEAAHFWNAAKFMPAPYAAPWVSEGGAELIATAALDAIGSLDAKAAQERIDRAIGECAAIAASRAWGDIPNRGSGRTPYACGLAMQLAIVAHLRRIDPGMDPLAFWGRFGAEASPYREASMAIFLSRHGDPVGSSFLLKMLTDGNTPYLPSLRSFYEMAGVRLVTGSAAPDSMKRPAGPATFAALMGRACDGSYGFYNRGDFLEIDDRFVCATFKGGMKITAVEGHNLFTDGAGVMAAVRSRCASPAQSVRVSRSDGDDILVACDEKILREIPNPDDLFGLAPGEAARLLAPAR